MTDARFAIALCTYNGAAHLAAQLESYRAQEERGWDLWVSDDGSTDATREIVAAFAAEVAPDHAVTLVEGPRRGRAVDNFLTLLASDILPEGRPVAVSDQDDIWLPHKLSRARAALRVHGANLLYGARSRHVTSDLTVLGESARFARPAGFGNALVQNIISGHSAVLGPEMAALVRRAGPVAVHHHDWWLYLLATGAGQQVFVDPEIVLLYRQHGSNVMGAHQGLRAKLGRLALLFGRDYAAWFDANIAALEAQAALLTPEARATLAALRAAPRAIGIGRARVFAAHGVQRQSRAADLALRLAVRAGRV